MRWWDDDDCETMRDDSPQEDLFRLELRGGPFDEEEDLDPCELLFEDLTDRLIGSRKERKPRASKYNMYPLQKLVGNRYSWQTRESVRHPWVTRTIELRVRKDGTWDAVPVEVNNSLDRILRSIDDHGAPLEREWKCESILGPAWESKVIPHLDPLETANTRRAKERVRESRKEAYRKRHQGLDPSEVAKKRICARQRRLARKNTERYAILHNEI